MTILIVGASRGLGSALVSGLVETGRQVIGVSRTRPGELSAACQGWIDADLSRPREAVDWIERHTPERLDVILYNVGLLCEGAGLAGHRRSALLRTTKPQHFFTAILAAAATLVSGSVTQ